MSVWNFFALIYRNSILTHSKSALQRHAMPCHAKPHNSPNPESTPPPSKDPMSPCSRFQSPLLPPPLPKPPIEELQDTHHIRSIHLHSRTPLLALHRRARLQARHPARQVVAGFGVVRMTRESGICVRAGEGQPCAAVEVRLGAAASAWVRGAGAGLGIAVRRCSCGCGKGSGGATGGETFAE